MEFWGANPEQLEAAGAALGRAADLIDHNRVHLDAQVHHAPWRGAEADRFRHDWDQLHARRLASAAAFLHAARTSLLQNAAAQRSASGAETGSVAAVHGGLVGGIVHGLGGLAATAARVEHELAADAARLGRAVEHEAHQAVESVEHGLGGLVHGLEHQASPHRPDREALDGAATLAVGALGAAGISLQGSSPNLQGSSPNLQGTSPASDARAPSGQAPAPDGADATAAHVASATADFVARHSGKPVDVDRSFGNQCWDLAAGYSQEVVGVPASAGFGLPTGDQTAAGVFSNFPAPLGSYYDRIPYEPGSVPRAGDLVVWDTGVGGGAGHIAIAVSTGSAQGFSSLDQNWPLGSSPHVVSHDYGHVAGFLRPKQVAP